jgi:hypothetical protein
MPHCVLSGNDYVNPEALSLKVLSVALHKQSNDEPEQSENRSKDLDGKDLDESASVSKPLSR